jgi:hypothetical protein
MRLPVVSGVCRPVVAVARLRPQRRLIRTVADGARRDALGGFYGG